MNEDVLSKLHDIKELENVKKAQEENMNKK